MLQGTRIILTNAIQHTQQDDDGGSPLVNGQLHFIADFGNRQRKL